MKPFLSILLTLVFCSHAFADDTLKTGDSVAARILFPGSSYYKYFNSTVTKVQGAQIEIDYAVDYGREKHQVSPEDIIRFDANAKFKVGDHVLAVYRNNAVMYPGIVTAASDGSLTVKWDDGSDPLPVPIHQVVAFKGDLSATAGGNGSGLSNKTNPKAKDGKKPKNPASKTGQAKP